VYYCDQCGSPIDFGGSSSVICQTCGANNINVEAEKAALEAKLIAESYLGNLEELEKRLKASGDSTARDYIFTKDFKPRLDIVFEDLLEKFEDHFRHSIFHFNILKKYNHLFDVSVVFENEQSQGFNKHFTRDLNQFAMGQLELPVMKLLAASESSKRHIEILKHHTMFLSRLFNIRGLALNINVNSVKAIINLLILAIKDCEFLEKKYGEIKNEAQNSLKFQLWKLRLNINLKIAQVLNSCFNNEYDNCVDLINNTLYEINEIINYLSEKSKKSEKSTPLFLLMMAMEGFNIDKKILNFLQKMITVLNLGNFQMNFLSFLTKIGDIIKIADTPFNNVKISSSEWDSNWIDTLEEPFSRLFEILDNIALNRKIINGEESVFILDVDNELFDVWQSNQVIIGKNMNKKYFSFKEDFLVKTRIFIYIPIAAINTYAILKKGFIKKGGDEFEAFLLVNPFFRFDQSINNYGYAKAFSYIDIEQALKENDPLKKEIANIENIIESETKNKLTQKRVLPILVTRKEIEEFVQKTYDLFEFSHEETDPIPRFKQIYKDRGIAKKVERLSGELLDFIYIPSLLLEIVKGQVKKGEFQAKSDAQWKLLLPFNNDPKNPWNKFLHMNIEPKSILEIVNKISELK